MKTGFIGVGNMGGALLRGLLDSGRLHSEDVLICGRDKEKTIRQAEEFHVKAAECHEELVEKCHVIFLGVSPQTFPLVMPRIKKTYKKEKIREFDSIKPKESLQALKRLNFFVKF